MVVDKKRGNRNKKWIPAAGIMILSLLCGGSLWFLRPVLHGTSPERKKDRFHGEIPVYRSEKDLDQDGIDDQTDYFQGVLTYIKSCPEYKSRYYAGGYPDDGYGVCTDLAASGFLAAGYDLRELVQEDILEHRTDYDIATPDPDIDYRRVRNLRVFFRNRAKEMTMDLHRLEEWQPGDIVLFRDHIGVVSDRRNTRGIPFLIHHSSPVQRSYEEDVLEKRKDMVGHYRFF